MRFYCLLCTTVFTFLSVHANEMDSLFSALDKALLERGHYLSIKENRLSALRKEQAEASGLEQQYASAERLMTEYRYYKSDSALHYANQCLLLATALKNEDLILEMQIDRAYFFCFQGLFHESFMILDALASEDLSLPLRKKYIYTYVHLCHNYFREIKFPPFKEKYQQDAIRYVNIYMETETEITTTYLELLAFRYYLEKEFAKALTTTRQLLAREDLSPYARAESLYHLGFIYFEAGETYTEAKKALIQASIMANELVMTKNHPLLFLGMLLVDEHKQVDRAYHYIHIASDDATCYNQQRRTSFIEKANHAIHDLYFARIKQQQRVLQIFILILIFFCLCITLILLVFSINNKALKNVRRALSETNHQLRDSNHIKDTYIIHFLNRYSAHLDKVDGYKKHIIRQLNTSQPNDVIKKEAMGLMNPNADLNLLFSEFDQSILKLYPNFIEKVNAFLLDDRKYVIKNSHKLNTELRILALLRLGIGDNKQIASFFRFTVQTVYNYRSKARTRAMNEEAFEDNIRKICTYT